MQRPLRLSIYLSVAAAVCTIAMKVLAYALTDSVGLLSDAMESGVNLFTALAAWFSLWYAARPVDADHTYGHEKIEFFSSGLEGALILVAAAGIAWVAVDRLQTPKEVERLDLGARLISLSAAAVNLVVGLLLIRTGRTHRSIALEANGRHLMTDVWTSVGVVAGLVLARLTGWVVLDPLLGLLMAANICWTAYDLIRRSFDGLMDHALPMAEQQKVREAIASQLGPGMHYHALRTRQAGARRFVDFHFLVPGRWTVPGRLTTIRQTSSKRRSGPRLSEASRSRSTSSRSSRRRPGKTATFSPSRRNCMSSREFEHRLEFAGRGRWWSWPVRRCRASTTIGRHCAAARARGLHGATSNPRLMEKFSGLTDKAESAGFIVGYPAGTGVLPNVLTWNGGDCCGFAQKSAIDDVGFLSQMIDDLESNLRIDPTRIYLAGMSNGAHIAYRTAAERSERIAAIACVAGPMATRLARPTRGMPVLHIHGTDDEYAPFAGGAGPRSVFGASLPSIPDTIAAWVRADDCPETPTISAHSRHGRRRHADRADAAYGPGRDGSGSGADSRRRGRAHVARPAAVAADHRSANRAGNLDANDVIWEFFEKHRSTGRR